MIIINCKCDKTKDPSSSICHSLITNVYPNVTSIQHLDDNHICLELGDEITNDIDLLSWQLGGKKAFDDGKEIMPTDISTNPLIVSNEIKSFTKGSGTIINIQNASMLSKFIEKVSNVLKLGK